MNLVKINEQQQQQYAHSQPANASIQTMEGFMKMLNEEPDPKAIKVNEQAKNSLYLPISFVQMKLDELFMGLWETKDFHYTVVVNEIVGHITLRYFHPISKSWIERTGSAAVMIMQSKGSMITDIGAKIKNTLQKDHPHLMASCITSAARTIGKVFGRDLNRKEEDSYTSMYTDIADSENALESIDWSLVKTVEDLGAIWKQHPALHKNKNFLKEFTYRKGQLPKAA